MIPATTNHEAESSTDRRSSQVIPQADDPEGAEGHKAEAIKIDGDFCPFQKGQFLESGVAEHLATTLFGSLALGNVLKNWIPRQNSKLGRYLDRMWRDCSWINQLVGNLSRWLQGSVVQDIVHTVCDPTFLRQVEEIRNIRWFAFPNGPLILII